MTRRLTVTLLAAVLVAFFGALPSHAATYSGNSTGYAFDGVYGANDVAVSQGDFANRSTVWCPLDPAASWPMGSCNFG